ncbi:MAG: ATP-binding protein [Ginsengibacter sp.]
MKKIVVIGPESTGKSTLCKLLASHYHTAWVPEYARAFLEKYGTAYSYDDLLKIANGQMASEDKMADEQRKYFEERKIKDEERFLFIDTDMYVMKVWCEYVFDQCHNKILNSIAERKYDAYLLCDVDLPWVADELREYPDPKERGKLFHFYKDLLVNQSTPWITISGDYEARLQNAIHFIDDMIWKK